LVLSPRYSAAHSLGPRHPQISGSEKCSGRNLRGCAGFRQSREDVASTTNHYRASGKRTCARLPEPVWSCRNRSFWWWQTWQHAPAARVPVPMDLMALGFIGRARSVSERQAPQTRRRMRRPRFARHSAGTHEPHGAAAIFGAV